MMRLKKLLRSPPTKKVQRMMSLLNSEFLLLIFRLFQLKIAKVVLNVYFKNHLFKELNKINFTHISHFY